MKQININKGIYKITNLVNNKVYIGSSTLLDYRKRYHLNFLKNNQHPNKHLQSAYSKYGEKNFEWDIVEYTPDFSSKQLEIREDYWIAIYQSLNPQYGYNQRIANRNEEYVGSGKIVKGENNFRAIQYELIDIFTKEIHSGRCAAEFARKMNIKNASGFFFLRNGKTNIWANRFVTKESVLRLKFYTFKEISSNRIVQHFLLSKISEIINISAPELSKLHNGYKKSLKGWVKHDRIEERFIIC